MERENERQGANVLSSTIFTPAYRHASPKGKATISLSINKRQRTHDNANRKPMTAREKTLL